MGAPAGSPAGSPPDPPPWPGLAWEEDLRRRAQHLGLSRALERFTAGGWDYLALEGPAGVTLWDVWDDPAYGAFERYGWLAQLADLLRTLHRTGAVVESLRPGQVHISPLGQLVLDASVVLFSHYPYGPGVTYRTPNADEVLAIFSRQRLLAVVSGHWHGNTEKRDRGVLFTTTASCSSTRPNHDKTRAKGYRIFTVRNGREIETAFKEVAP